MIRILKFTSKNHPHKKVAPLLDDLDPQLIGLSHTMAPSFTLTSIRQCFDFRKKKHFAELLSQGEKHWGDPYKKDLLR